MSARDDILAGIRRGLGRGKLADGPAGELTARVAAHRRNLVPARAASLDPPARVEHFVAMAEAVQTSVARLASENDVPAEVARYLAAENLPAELRMAPDPGLDDLPWAERPLLHVRRGKAEPGDAVSLTPCLAAVAETGTLMLVSGETTPTTLNFLPDTHVVVLRAGQVVASYEDGWDLLRKRRGAGPESLPRTVNFITGPSRTGDIEQKIELGAHGPRRLHVILIDDAETRRTGSDTALWQRAVRDDRPLAPRPPGDAPGAGPRRRGPAPGGRATAGRAVRRDAITVSGAQPVCRYRSGERRAAEARQAQDRGAARPARHDPGRGAPRAARLCSLRAAGRQALRPGHYRARPHRRRRAQSGGAALARRARAPPASAGDRHRAAVGWRRRRALRYAAPQRDRVGTVMAQGGEMLASIERLRAARVLCIGDVMLDHYIYGTVDRLSPEAPVPVLAIDSESHNLGGAGNVLRNLAALGAGMSFVSVVGNDAAGREVQNLLAELDGAEIHVLVQPQRVTTVKTRFIHVNQQLLRADRESAAPLGPYIRDDLLRLVRELVTSRANVVAISDYAKGVLTDGVAFEIVKTAQEARARVVVEPKGGDHIRYRGADVLTPSRRELAQATGMPATTPAEIAVAARSLIERCGFGAVVVLLGRDGMFLVKPESSLAIPTPASGESHDSGGTEDTAVATLAAGIGAGLPLEMAAQIAGVAVGIARGKTGTAVASAGELAAALASEARSEPAEQAGLRIEMTPQPRAACGWREAEGEGAPPAGRQRQRLAVAN